MQKWLLIALLVLQIHFAASYLVPLDARSQAEFGGLLRWFWPWSNGDASPLGQITTNSGFPMGGFYLAMAAAGVLAVAALAVLGVAPVAWWRALTVVGAVALTALLLLFFGPTKVLPLLVAAATAYLALTKADFLSAGT